MTYRITATVNVEVSASQKAAEAASDLRRECDLDPTKPFELTSLPAWMESEAKAEAAAMAQARSTMKGWKQSRTDIGIFWCGLRGWTHQFQTYWERSA